MIAAETACRRGFHMFVSPRPDDDLPRLTHNHVAVATLALMIAAGLGLEQMMNRRELGLVLAIAASLAVTGGASAFAQSGDASAAGLSAVAADAEAPASGVAPRSTEANSAPAAGLTAAAEIPSGAAPNCLTPSPFAGLPSVSRSLTSSGAQQPLETTSSLSASGSC